MLCWCFLLFKGMVLLKAQESGLHRWSLPLELFYWYHSSFDSILFVPIFIQLQLGLQFINLFYNSLPHFQRSQPKFSNFIKFFGYYLNCFIIFCVFSGSAYSSHIAYSIACFSLPLRSITYPPLYIINFSKLQ